jgi:hypothetical protein
MSLAYLGSLWEESAARHNMTDDTTTLMISLIHFDGKHDGKRAGITEQLCWYEDESSAHHMYKLFAVSFTFSHSSCIRS